MLTADIKDFTEKLEKGKERMSYHPNSFGKILCIVAIVIAFMPGLAASKQLGVPAPRLKDLNIRLLGTIAGNASVKCAIIRNNRTGIEKICYPGDLIAGAELKKIERGKITLVLDGKESVISMKQFAKNGQTPRQRNAVLTEKKENSGAAPLVAAIYKPMKKEDKFSFQKR